MQAAAPSARSPMLTALCCDLCDSTAKQQPGSGLAPDSVSRAEVFRDAKSRLEARACREMERFGGEHIHSAADNLSGGFDNPEHALVCALALQQSLRSDPVLLPAGRMEIRIGLHTATTHRDASDYLGDPGNVAARLHAFAPVGGVVVSAETKKACRGLEGMEWIPKGNHQPKGLHEPVEVFEARCSPEALLRLIPRMIERAAGQRKAREGPAEPTDEELLRAFATSLRPVAEECSKLVTRGLLLGGESLQKQPRLAQVYVSLDTKSARPVEGRKNKPMSEERVPLSALEALLDPESTRVVIVGEPGSGKSTFVQYVTLCLADQLCVAGGLPSQLIDHEVPPLLRQRKLVPMRILLREFAPTLGPAAPGTAEHVVNYLRGQLGGDAAVRLTDLLKRGLAFVLFDGLDEVHQKFVPVVKQAIAAFPKVDYFRCRIAVTCRTESYKRPEFQLAGFPAPHEIAPLSSAHRTRFVCAWYQELEQVQPQFKGEGTACAASLLGALNSDRLRDMAANPFFLTAMAALHRPDRPLPDTGARLMDELVNGVLEESRKRRADEDGKASQSELATLLANVPDGLPLLRQRLEAIAFKARESRKDRDSRFLDEDLLRQRLRLARAVDDDWIEKLLEILRHRAGLLQSRDGRCFEFAYRFEEFLAGCYLTNDDQWPDGPAFARRCADLFTQQGDYARQVVLWAAGFNVHVRKRRGPVRELVSLLVPAKVLPDEPSLQRLELAADIARDAGTEHWLHDDVPDAPATVSRLRSTLETVRDDPRGFPIKARDQAASSIGRLGDVRPGVGLKGGLPDLVWCGPRGERAADKPLDFRHGFVRDGEKRAFFIGKYPITVAQFRAFLEAPDGYHHRDSWNWPEVPEMMKWWEANHQDGPSGHDPVFQTPNHPRVGVCWYEAVAFCRWLSEREKVEIRLPHENEWQLAAQWDGKKQDRSRYFAWGGTKHDGDFAQHCNCDQTGLRHTSAVGLFPSGKTDCGAMDLSGNVWEWCADWHHQYRDTRVLRGGSWREGNPAYLSCSRRGFGGPGHRRETIGFRCVVVSGLVR